MKYIISLSLGFAIAGLVWWQLDRIKRENLAQQKILQQDIKRIMTVKNLKSGLPIFIRIFKKSSELELWMQKNNEFIHVKTYPICRWSGNLGPKLEQGDKQSPEGFYKVAKHQLNPDSKYHLSFNLGYPNKYDRAHERTGNFLMVHGKCVSAGCYAITDVGIDEVYQFAEDALGSGQSQFEVHVFPFRMNDENLQEYKDNRWYSFWLNLKPAYDWFETNKTLPIIRLKNKNYIISG